MKGGLAAEPASAALPPLRATTQGQNQRTADNFYKAKVQQSGQGGMVGNHALSLANMGPGGQSTLNQPSRFVRSGQRQRADSLQNGYPRHQEDRGQAHSNYNYGPTGGGVRSVAAQSGYGYQNYNHFNLHQAREPRKTASSTAGNNYPYANQGANFNQSEHGAVSQASGTRSVMIRTRGTLPKTLWQKGAMFSTRKSRKQVSMGQSPSMAAKKGKKNLLATQRTYDLEAGRPSLHQRRTFQYANAANESGADHKVGTLSELNRLTQGSFANLGGMRAQRQLLATHQNQLPFP